MYDGAMSDYERVARVIRHLDEHHTLQPGLDELARIAGLSPYHFHRLFSAWAGVTPKDFLQCLTLEHAKALLHQGQDVLSAALEAGLSGPGRLHDLCVTLEAVSPGELKNGGSSLNIRFGFAATPFGDCLIGECERGLCHLAFVDDQGPDAALDDLRNTWPEARLTQSDRTAAGLASRIFERPVATRARSTLRAFVKGSAFQVRVWRSLLRVPPGCLVTYGQLAGAIGQPNAARAVGSAVGQNPLAYLIPCHRVIRETGVIGDYRWGRVRKRAIVGWETSRRIERGPLTAATGAAHDLVI
jgi:AraC family transcriptional regulator of adaptative response/methylated-DNA-[protein]-cysteine methyltransferase